MCGICGFTGHPDNSPEVLKKMTDIMTHRGPDGEGAYVTDQVALGHRRLAIIDLDNGAQPMFSKDGTIAIVFNGEIYNYLDMEKELNALGYEYRTRSDTEALLVGYQAYGTDVLKKVRGMFAFAIWDANKQQLFCARDFFGIKPFYYTIQNGNFIFASEIKSILEHPDCPKELNPEALEQYLSFQ